MQSEFKTLAAPDRSAARLEIVSSAPNSTMKFKRQFFFCCERLSASMARSLHLSLSLFTTSRLTSWTRGESNLFFFPAAAYWPVWPGDQGRVEPRPAVSLRPEGHRQYHYTTAPADEVQKTVNFCVKHHWNRPEMHVRHLDQEQVRIQSNGSQNCPE